MHIQLAEILERERDQINIEDLLQKYNLPQAAGERSNTYLIDLQRLGSVAFKIIDTSILFLVYFLKIRLFEYGKLFWHLGKSAIQSRSLHMDALPYRVDIIEMKMRKNHF